MKYTQLILKKLTEPPKHTMMYNDDAVARGHRSEKKYMYFNNRILVKHTFLNIYTRHLLIRTLTILLINYYKTKYTFDPKNKINR